MGVAIRGWPKTASRPNRTPEKPNILFSRFVKITGCPFFAGSPQKIWSGVTFIFAFRENNRIAPRRDPMFYFHVS